jgi:outer membrane protein
MPGKRLLSVTLGFLLFFSFVAYSDEVPTYTLSDVYRITLKKNDDLRLATESLKQSESAVKKATAILLPKFAFNSQFTHYDRRVSFNMAGMAIDIFPQNTYNITLTLIQPIYNGGRNIGIYKQAKLGKEIADNSVVLTKQNVLLGVTAAYYQVIKSQKNLEITRSTLELTRRELKVAQARYKVGEVTVTAVIQAEMGLKNSERELVQRENELKIAKENFRLLTGIKGDFVLVEPEEPSLPQGNLDDLVTKGFSERLEMKMNELELNLARQELAKARGRFLPTVSAQAMFLRQSAEFPAKQYASVSLNFSLPIFDGGVGFAELKEGKSKEQQAIINRDRLIKEIRLQVNQAYLNLQTVTAALETVEKQVELAKKNYELVSRFFAVGESTSLELSQALIAYDDAQKSLASLKYDRYLAIKNLEKSIGTFASEYIFEEDDNEKR